MCVFVVSDTFFWSQKELLNVIFSLPLFSLCSNMLHIRQAILLKGRQHELDGKCSFLDPTFNLFTKYFYSTYYVSGITPTTSRTPSHLMSSWQACGGGIISDPSCRQGSWGTGQVGSLPRIPATDAWPRWLSVAALCSSPWKRLHDFLWHLECVWLGSVPSSITNSASMPQVSWGGYAVCV